MRDLLERLAAEGATEWLDGMPWQWWFTLTPKGWATDLSDEKMEAMLLRLVRDLARVTRDHFAVAYAIGAQERGAAHGHGVLYQLRPSRLFRPDRIEEARDLIGTLWQRDPAAGMFELKAHHVGGGDVAYAMKHERWNVEVVCPQVRPRCRHKRRGCPGMPAFFAEENQSGRAM